MTANGWLQILLFSAVILLLTKPLGLYMFRVFEGERQPLPRFLGRVERVLYSLCGIDPKREQTWQEYTAALAFSLLGLLITYAIERLQHVLPLNPQGLPAVPADLAFNTAASFTTNTNWQAYSGEATMSYLTQMAGIAWHNFTSAAAGIAIAIALARGLTRRLSPAAHHRQLLGRPDPLHRLPLAADLHSAGAGARRPRRDPELRTVRPAHHARGRQADAGHGTGGVAGGDQGAGHQRRWLFQRQQRASV